ISELARVIDYAIRTQEPDRVSRWIRLRPLADTAEIIRIVTPHSAHLDPSAFFELSGRQIHLGNMEEALFWRQIWRLRIKFDTLRCGLDNPSGNQMIYPFGDP